MVYMQEAVRERGVDSQYSKLEIASCGYII